MINLFMIDINFLPDPRDNTDLLICLPKAKQEKILRLSMCEKRKQAWASALILKKILNDHNLSFDDIYYGDNNKPLCPNLYFNISHSKNLVVCVTSKSEIGCDIEKIDYSILPERVTKISERFFHKNETALLDEIDSSQKDSRLYTFYRLWTIKESYVKMTGEGLSIPLDCFQVKFIDNYAHIHRDDFPMDCYITETDYEGYHISVCSQEPEGDILCTLINHPLS